MSISSKSDRWDTNSVRWKAPYDYSFAYRLFKIHYTEINNAYWASVPAYNTIKKEVLTYRVNNPIKNPLDFFIVRDEDDRRIAQTFDEWKNHHELFGKFNRLNMMFLATSCMEVYLRSIVSLALESKPSVLFYGHILVDGVLPMIRDNRYSCYADKKYPFYHIVDNICSGRWIDRYNTYEKYFGANNFLCNELDRLDEYRKKGMSMHIIMVARVKNMKTLYCCNQKN